MQEGQTGGTDMSRRHALRRMGLAGIVLSALGGFVLVNCGQASTPSQPTASGSAAPSAQAAPSLRVLAPERDERAEAYTNPRRVLARLQGDLERVAAGKERFKLPEGVSPDALEAFVEAYRKVLSGDPGANDALASVAAEAKKRLEKAVDAAKAEGSQNDPRTGAEGDIADYTKRMAAIAEAKPEGAEGTILRLAATMRLVDGALVLESNNPTYNASYDLFERKEGSYIWQSQLFRDGMYLRLPCRTLSGRRSQLEAAAKRLGKAAGPLLACPVPAKKQGDFDLMERFEKDPAATTAAVLAKPEPEETPNRAAKKEEPAAPAPPWDRSAAIIFMAENPDAAEKPLEAAAKKDVVGKLDYALFLFAFRPESKERDGKIKKLLAEVEKASTAAAKKRQDEFLLEDTSLERRAYDGTDESLLGILRLASSAGAAETTSSFYAIPCAVLLKRPKLLAATTPLFGGNRDNFLPRSGCSWGRGFLRGFPDAEMAAWRGATEEADGHFYVNHGGTMRFALASALNEVEETTRTNPQSLLENPAKTPTPYETWSYMNPENRAIYGRLSKIAADLKAKLVEHYKTRGLSEKDATTAADAGIAHVVWGADCGEAAPPKSLRKLVADGASADDIRAFIKSGEYRDKDKLEPFRKCAEQGGMDPLIHLAVLNPKALPVLLEEKGRVPADQAKELDFEVDPNATTDFGKTPLMAAAQQDAVESAKILLDHGASPFRTTMKSLVSPLRHDARTALMYAAARGSLPMIKLLLDAGSDKYAADTTGQTALQWLLGHGPLPPNSRLSEAERAEAVKLLY